MSITLDSDLFPVCSHEQAGNYLLKRAVRAHARDLRFRTAALEVLAGQGELLHRIASIFQLAA